MKEIGHEINLRLINEFEYEFLPKNMFNYWFFDLWIFLLMNIELVKNNSNIPGYENEKH